MVTIEGAMSKVLRLIGRAFHRDTVYEIRCANCGREYESTCSRKEARGAGITVAKKNWSRPIYRDGNIVGYTPAASPLECLVAVVRAGSGMTRVKAVRFIRRAQATKPNRGRK